jgi:DNA-binding response OmpR family regulator
MKRILIIDDDHEVLNAVSFLLIIHGFTVETASSVEMITDKIDAFKPDLIMLDVALRGEDGRNVCRRLKNNPVYKIIRLILFSANLTVHSDFKDCGADDFIEKPFEIEELLQKINFKFSAN